MRNIWKQHALFLGMSSRQCHVIEALYKNTVLIDTDTDTDTGYSHTSPFKSKRPTWWHDASTESWSIFTKWCQEKKSQFTQSARPYQSDNTDHISISIVKPFGQKPRAVQTCQLTSFYQWTRPSRPTKCGYPGRLPTAEQQFFINYPSSDFTIARILFRLLLVTVMDKTCPSMQPVIAIFMRFMYPVSSQKPNGKPAHQEEANPLRNPIACTSWTPSDDPAEASLAVASTPSRCLQTCFWTSRNARSSPGKSQTKMWSQHHQSAHKSANAAWGSLGPFQSHWCQL